MLDTDVLTHMNQVKGKLKDEHLAKHETQAMLKDKHVRIIALSDVSHELSNQEVDSWIKLSDIQEEIERRYDHQTALLLCHENGRRLIAGEPLVHRASR